MLLFLGRDLPCQSFKRCTKYRGLYYVHMRHGVYLLPASPSRLCSHLDNSAPYLCTRPSIESLMAPCHPYSVGTLVLRTPTSFPYSVPEESFPLGTPPEIAHFCQLAVCQTPRSRNSPHRCPEFLVRPRSYRNPLIYFPL